MKLNIECMRSIMFYLEENLTAWRDNAHPNKIVFNKIDLFEISKNFENNYDAEDVWHSTKMLFECGFIECNINKSTDNFLALIDVLSITYRGHQFIESIRSDNIWNRTKSVVGKVGSHTIKFVEETAQMIAVESAKQAIAISLTGKSL